MGKLRAKKWSEYSYGIVIFQITVSSLLNHAAKNIDYKKAKITKFDHTNVGLLKFKIVNYQGLIFVPIS